MFDVINDKDDINDATDNHNGDDTADKKSIDDQEDTVDAVEDNGDDSATNKTLPSDGFRFLLDSSTLTYRSSFP
jgi:hypothetical protein